MEVHTRSLLRSRRLGARKRKSYDENNVTKTRTLFLWTNDLFAHVLGSLLLNLQLSDVRGVEE